MRTRGEGISIARGSEVEGNRGGREGVDKVIRGRPESGGWPVKSSGGGDDQGFVWRNVITEEFKRGWWGFKTGDFWGCS